MSTPKYRTSCDSCLNSKVKCSQTKPSCSRCLQHSNECVYSQYRKIGRPSKRATSHSVSHSQQSKKAAHQRQFCSPHASPTGIEASKNDRIEHSHSPAQVSCRPGLDGRNESIYHALETTTPSLFSPGGFRAAPDNGLLTPPDMSDPYNFYADMNLFECDMAAPDLSHLSNVFDTSGALPTPEMIRLETVQDRVQDAWQAETTLFTATPEGSSTCSADSPPMSSVPAHAYSSSHVPSVSDNAAHGLKDLNLFATTIPNYTQHSAMASLSECGQNSGSLSPQTRNFNNSSMRCVSMPDELPDSSCSNDCYSVLTEQLRHLNQFLSRDRVVPLDALLNLDEQVCRERERVLRCTSCLSNVRSRHTLMLVIMVLEVLLGLFERYCDVSRTSPSGTRNADESAFPRTHPTFTVGDFEVDESTEGAFTRALLRMHFERQVSTVLRLNQALALGARDVGYKVGREILVDVCRRLEQLQGLVSLNTE